MNRSPATLREIAAAAGCSTRVVAAVLNPGSSTVRVSEKTGRRILEMARERGYRPNQLARAVATGKSRVLGIVTESSELEHKAYMLTGAVQAANACDYLIKLLPLPRRLLSQDLIEKCLEWRLAGLAAVNMSSEVNECLRAEAAKLHIPMAFVDNVESYEGCISVVSDDHQGVRLAIEHLVELGHRDIGFLGGTPDSPASQSREAAFRSVLAKLNMEIHENWILHSGWGDESIIAPAARALIENSEDRPTAILCAGDPIAMTLIRIAREVGLIVPKDLSVVGFANFYLARFCDPPLTTIEQPFTEMGRVAVERLIARAESGPDTNAAPLHQCLPTRLVERRSTGHPNRT